MSTSLVAHVLGISVADCVELTEKRRSSFSVRVEEYILEESPHKMQIVKTKSAGMCFFGQKQDDLSEIISNEALIRIS